MRSIPSILSAAVLVATVVSGPLSWPVFAADAQGAAPTAELPQISEPGTLLLLGVSLLGLSARLRARKRRG